MTQPRRPDEIELYRQLRAFPHGHATNHPGRAAIERIASDIGICDKRTNYILEKWYAKGWIDCGINVWGGWFTDKAPESLQP